MAQSKYNQIVLYSNGCPKCNILKRKLDGKQIRYTEVNDVDAMVAMGFKSVPMLQVDNVILSFAEANAWVNHQ